MKLAELKKIKIEINSNKKLQDIHDFSPIIQGETKEDIAKELKELFVWLSEDGPEWYYKYNFSLLIDEFLHQQNNMFGKFYFKMVDDKTLRKLNGNDAKVLLVFLRHADINTGITFIGNRRLANEAGVSFTHISENIGRLLEHKLLINLKKAKNKTWYRKVNLLGPINANFGDFIK